MKEITIAGAGLTGTLLAILLAKQGYLVRLYERNKEPKSKLVKSGKSINLTLCKRGISALNKAGLSEDLRKLWVPVYGRCLHSNESTLEIQPYGNYEEALYSISRHELNTLLISVAKKTPGISIEFGLKCVGYELSKSSVFFIDENQAQVERQFTTLIAADGVYSAVRHQMQRNFGFNYSQFYSEHVNKELTIPAEQANMYKLERNHLHIWPRNEFMIIAFPNRDGSLTCTLQLPLDGNDISFRNLKSESEVLYYFQKLFPDAIPLLPNLVEEFFTNPEIPMVTVRCSPWYVEDKLLLLGDAAHGIWPSYGQGANAGFEDCEVLCKCLLQNPDDLQTAFAKFQEMRLENVNVIADLSENHFNEIRHLVADAHFLIRKKVERQMNLMFPSEYFSLYSRIAFTKMPYKQAVSAEGFYRGIIDELLEKQEIMRNPESRESEKLILEVYQNHLNQIDGYSRCRLA